MTSNTKIIIADDHPLFRQALSLMLKSSFVCSRLLEAETIPQLEEKLATISDIDLILLDLNMKGMSGLDTLKALRTDGSSANIVILTVSDSPADIEAIVKAGADGYLLKDTEPDELIELLKQAHHGDKAYSSVVSRYLNDAESRNDIFDQLTEREMQILQEVAKGYRNKQIADHLFISESTVKVHMKSLLKKLQVPSRTAATVLYLERYGDMK